MKEILKDTVSSIEYKLFKNGILTEATGAVKVSVWRGETKVIDDQDATSTVDGIYTFDLPVTATVDSVVVPVTSENGLLEVVWSFTLSGNEMRVTDYHKVVTPYVNWEYFHGTQTSYADFLEVERIARYVINTYCGQQFDKETTTYTIEGHGENSLSLPRRLLTLDTVTWLDKSDSTNVIGADYSWEVTANGWVLRRQPYPYYSDITYAPKTSFKRNTTYNVAGLWGYYGIPTEIEEAAKILCVDYQCPQHLYRDKYLKSIKIDNWRLEFMDQAFKTTGNVTADQLLTDYRLLPGIGMI